MSERPAKAASDSRVTLSLIMMPEHANMYGNVHGGVIMKLVDEAAGTAAVRHAQRPVVTVAIDSMTFLSPVHVGELISCSAKVTYVGRTSIEVRVTVEAEDIMAGKKTHTNSACAVFVALDDDRRPCDVPGLLITSDEERRDWELGRARQEARVTASKRPGA
ncbi:MAG: acyl-CoA thioesterase [Polyangiaceae bacterium]|nr:acyl-CoA thioesterase [Polyangiaceae bacterium]